MKNLKILILLTLFINIKTLPEFFRLHLRYEDLNLVRDDEIYDNTIVP